jgi:hypothetical protein
MFLRNVGITPEFILCHYLSVGVLNTKSDGTRQKGSGDERRERQAWL